MTIKMWNHGFSRVEKDAFDSFIAAYPRKLRRHLVTIVEPPLLTFTDSKLGKYPDSIVAGRYCYDDHGEYWIRP